MWTEDFPLALPPDPRRFEAGQGEIMKAVVTREGGGFDKLEYRDVPVPRLLPGTTLIRVLAAGVNNTEINTRLGWYSSQVSSGTDENGKSRQKGAPADGGWSAPTPFPFIQGTDCCGEVVDIYSGFKASDEHSRSPTPTSPGRRQPRVGDRVLVRSCMRSRGFDSQVTVWMGSDFDGAFAEYVLAPTSEVFPVDSSFSNEELGAMPCAWGTAENMLHRAGPRAGETVIIKGASGGVGSAAISLALRRNARVVAVTSPGKIESVRSLGAHRVISRNEDLLEILGSETADLIVDNVGGPEFEKNTMLLRRGGRMVSSGAIAGPLVQSDLRDIYLKDLRIIGTTAWDPEVFPNLVGYIESEEIRPRVCATLPLEQIVSAQKLLLQREHVGKIVLIP